MGLVQELAEIVGSRNVLIGADMSSYLSDWTGAYSGDAEAVVRPASTEDVSAIVKAAYASGTKITVQSGNTSVAGGSVPTQSGGIVLSLGRLNTIRNIDIRARTATVDAGVVLQTLQEKVGERGLDFPLMFGARGSAMIGGTLATNAGGSNVLRYGNARDLCLGIEAVLPNGDVIHGLTGLRKDNTGYDLKDLMIGAEGTLGVITGAVLKLVPTPSVRSTAFLALSDMGAALDVLHALQDSSGGLVEAFEWMPGDTVAAIVAHNSRLRAPLETPAEVGILVELASTRPSDGETDDTGSRRLDRLMLDVVEGLMEKERVVDGFFATSEQQRIDLWALREEVLETIRAKGSFLSLDAALPLSLIEEFLEQAEPITAAAHLQSMPVAHLGDGNIHYAVVAAEGHDWASLDLGAYSEKMINLIVGMGGTFSAEHGIGRSKVKVLAAQKDPAQLAVMRQIKHALDPDTLLNPGVLFAEG